MSFIVLPWLTRGKTTRKTRICRLWALPPIESPSCNRPSGTRALGQHQVRPQHDRIPTRYRNHRSGGYCSFASWESCDSEGWHKATKGHVKSGVAPSPVSLPRAFPLQHSSTKKVRGRCELRSGVGGDFKILSQVRHNPRKHGETKGKTLSFDSKWEKATGSGSPGGWTQER